MYISLCPRIFSKTVHFLLSTSGNLEAQDTYLEKTGEGTYCFNCFLKWNNLQGVAVNINSYKVGQEIRRVYGTLKFMSCS
jgi:hypothetical protein